MAVESAGPSTALIQNDIVLFGLIAATLGVVFWTASRDTGFWKKFYTYVPALLLCYFIPGIYNSIGLIDGNASKLYNPVASRVLLPAALSLAGFVWLISLHPQAAAAVYRLPCPISEATTMWM